MSDTKYYVCGMIIMIAILVMINIPENIITLAIRHFCTGVGVGYIAARITLWLFNE